MFVKINGSCENIFPHCFTGKCIQFMVTTTKSYKSLFSYHYFWVGHPLLHFPRRKHLIKSNTLQKNVDSIFSVTNNIFKVIYPNVTFLLSLHVWHVCTCMNEAAMSAHNVHLTEKTWELGLFTRLTLQKYKIDILFNCCCCCS